MDPDRPGCGCLPGTPHSYEPEFAPRPGYCINGNHLERHNLWTDAVVQDAFVFLWEAFARRYRDISSADLSFDLINEPPAVGQYEMTRENHAALIRRTAAAIRAIDPGREIVIDGLGEGTWPCRSWRTWM
jgi:endoglucanase